MLQSALISKFLIPVVAAGLFFSGAGEVKDVKLFSIISHGIKQKAAFEKKKRETREQKQKREERIRKTSQVEIHGNNNEYAEIYIKVRNGQELHLGYNLTNRWEEVCTYMGFRDENDVLTEYEDSSGGITYGEKRNLKYDNYGSWYRSGLTKEQREILGDATDTFLIPSSEKELEELFKFIKIKLDIQSGKVKDYHFINE